MYKIIQNLGAASEYEYAHEYATLEDAREDVAQYIADDAADGLYDGYTIINGDGDDAEEKEAETFRRLAMAAMADIGLPEDEAEAQLEDFLQY